MSAWDFCASVASLAVTLGCASTDLSDYRGPAWRAVEFIHRGSFCTEPCDFPIYVRVEPRPENRTLWVSCVSETFERTAAIELNERSAATQDRFLFRGLIAGEYTCRAIVIRSDGSSRHDETRIKVIGRSP